MHAFYELARSHGIVRSFVQAMESEPPHPDWRAALAQLLAILPAHVAAEEEDGGFCAIVAEHLGADLARGIRDEHQVLIAEAGPLGRLLETDDPSLVEAARRYAGRIGAHEAWETDLAVRCEGALQSQSLN